MTNPDSAGGLLPCPFCGSAAERIDFGVGSGDNEGGSCIACTKCQASGPVEFGYKENFVSNWNRRAELCRAAPAGGDVTGLHPATADLVARFAAALAEKLAAAERKYGYSDGWASPDWMDECRAKLMEHVAKGDPRDVAAYCAFLWHHGESTSTGQTSDARDAQDAARYRFLIPALYRDDFTVGEAAIQLHTVGPCPTVDDVAAAIDAAMEAK